MTNRLAEPPTEQLTADAQRVIDGFTRHLDEADADHLIADLARLVMYRGEINETIRRSLTRTIAAKLFNRVMADDYLPRTPEDRRELPTL